MLVAGVLSRCVAALFSSRTDPLGVAAGATLKCLGCFRIGSCRVSSTDDVVGIDLAD